MVENLAAVHPEPDMVQLLTPEGQRVEHPDYPLDISNDEIASLSFARIRSPTVMRLT